MSFVVIVNIFCHYLAFESTVAFFSLPLHFHLNKKYHFCYEQSQLIVTIMGPEQERHQSLGGINSPFPALLEPEAGRLEAY